ncbi:MAG TPA: hypothetical protein VGG02_11410 [Chthoniobacterales bacterium]|jgi:hypothetical protein
MNVKSWSLLLGASILFVAFAVALIWVVMRLLRSNREQILATAPLLPEQEVTIRAPGEMILLIETSRFDTDYRNLEFEVLEKTTGRSTKLKYGYMRGQGAVHGVTTMRVPIGNVIAQSPGAFVVRVTGLEPGRDYTRSRMLFSRPYLGRMALQIIGIVLCAVGMLLSLLLAAWQLFPLQTAS